MIVVLTLLFTLSCPLPSHGEPSSDGEIADRGTRFAGGDGSDGNPYQISDVSQLQNMISDLDAHYVLISDIDASGTRDWNGGKGFDPVGGSFTDAFVGHLDGRNHIIFDLSIERMDSFVGLFGYLGPPGTVVNVSLEDVYASGNDYVGGVVGMNREGLVDNCRMTGTTDGTVSIGGLVGVSLRGTVRNSYASSTVIGDRYIGGLVGSNQEGTVDNCSATGTVTGDSSFIGGLIGSNSRGTVVNSFSNCDVSGGATCGGLVGYNDEQTIENCYATGTVYGGDACGGLVGHNGGTVKNSFATGTVNGGSEYNGGLVGFNPEGTVEDCYSTGTVSGEQDTGGLVGLNFRGTVSNSFWDTQSSGTSESSGGTGKNTLEMKSEGTFTDVDWDLWDTWFIAEGTTYPMLQSLYSKPVILTNIDDEEVTKEDELYSAQFDNRVSWLPGCVNAGSYSPGTICPWLSMTPSGLLTGTPSNGDVGEWDVYVTVTDLARRSTTLPFTLEVLNVNDDPVITTAHIGSATEGVPYSVVLDGYDDDPSMDELVWAIQTDVSFLSVDAGTGELSGIPTNDDVGEWQVTLLLSDGLGGQASRTLTLMVMNTNDDPVISTISLPDAVEDEPYRTKVEAFDIDPTGDLLT